MTGKTFTATVVAVAGLFAGGIYMSHLQTKPKPAPPPTVSVTGTVKVEKLRGGAVVEAESVNKTLTGAGIRQLIACLIGDSANHYDTAAYICIGNDSTATDTSMTALVGATKYWGNIDSITKSANWVKWWRTFTSAQANQAWYEIAIFNDSAKIMLDRAPHGSWGTKTTADTWTASVKLTFN